GDIPFQKVIAYQIEVFLSTALQVLANSYGRYGAYTDSGEAVSEPIDAINIRSMEIKINNLNCRRK
ncbi:hypothetical protein PO234_22125, partial [Bacteroides ovatus]|nr:hypothetical protein [Bacteroides ovatus]